ncbi:Uncharacterised protein [Enterobacter hormaechei]|nr:Uncharacterised protein [Enterobacter hormaechei]VAE68310.1 Uncharacterised protein [Enterobacter hormaechei]
MATSYSVGGTKVVGARNTGWTASTGTASKAGINGSTTYAVSATYTQSEIYADEASKLQNTRLKNVLMKGDLTPEVVNNMLFSKNKSEVQNLYNSVGQVGRAQMRNGIIGKSRWW